MKTGTLVARLTEEMGDAEPVIDGVGFERGREDRPKLRDDPGLSLTSNPGEPRPISSKMVLSRGIIGETQPVVIIQLLVDYF